MKKIILALCVILHVTNSSAQQQKIENDFVVLELKNSGIALYSKKNNALQVKNIQVEGNVLNSSKNQLADAVWGNGEELVIKCDNGRTLLFQLFANNPFVQIHTSIKNNGQKDLVLKDLAIADLALSINKTLNLNALGTGGFSPISQAKGSFTYNLIADPATRNSILVSWLTQLQGLGYMTPGLLDNECKMKVGLEFGNFIVKPGKERKTDVLMIGFFEDGRAGLELYGDYLAKSYNIKLPQKPNVYCTWYHRDVTGSGASNEKTLLENAEFSAKNLAPFGLNVMQIDDEWQSSMVEGLTFKNQKKEVNGVKLGHGPIKTFEEANFNFPKGMANTATELKKNGFIPGIWFMPFAGDVHNPIFNKNIFAKDALTSEPYEVKNWSGTCIDATNPAGEEFLRKRFKRIYDWGYRYFKIDGLHTGAPSENIYITRAYEGKPSYGNATLYNPDMTFMQCFRKGLSIMKEEAPEAFLLGCTVTQNMSSFAASFGLVDAMRVGPDNDRGRIGRWKNVIAGADFAGNLYFLNNKVWYNDSDPYYVRSTNPKHKARWMVSWQSISGALSTTSEQFASLPADRLDLIKRGLPTHNFHVRPIDILENEHPNIWLVTNKRMYVVGLFNWKESELTQIKYPFEKMGLDSKKEYELFDYWDNKYLGKFSKELNIALDSASCKVLAVKEAKPYPQLLSTSRHITQGMMDVLSENWDEKTFTLTGNSAVVKDDAYEFRLINPAGYKMTQAYCNGVLVDYVSEKSLIRVKYMPTLTGNVEWKFKFKRSE